MEAALTALQDSALADTVRYSRWVYAGVNGTHVLAVALLVGAIVPMDLRLLGLWQGIDRAALARVLVPVAAIGLVLALVTGPMLFATRAVRYASYDIVLLKLALVGLGAGLAILLHARAGLWIDRATPRQAAFHGAASLVCWIGALACGRLIAYV
ncbi:MAG: hypothetical protein AAF371_13860 [Pseudomonadota bacterium]